MYASRGIARASVDAYIVRAWQGEAQVYPPKAHPNGYRSLSINACFLWLSATRVWHRCYGFNNSVLLTDVRCYLLLEKQVMGNGKPVAWLPMWMAPAFCK